MITCLIHLKFFRRTNTDQLRLHQSLAVPIAQEFL